MKCVPAQPAKIIQTGTVCDVLCVMNEELKNVEEEKERPSAKGRKLVWLQPARDNMSTVDIETTSHMEPLPRQQAHKLPHPHSTQGHQIAKIVKQVLCLVNYMYRIFQLGEMRCECIMLGEKQLIADHGHCDDRR